MHFLDSYQKFADAGFDKDLVNSIINKFEINILTKASIFQTHGGEIFLHIHGTQDGSFHTDYYYDANGNENQDNIWYKKLSHIAYDNESQLYQEHISSEPVHEMYKTDQHKPFEIYESRFAKRQTLVGYNPKYGRYSNIYQLCNGEIKFVRQHDLCNRIFLEFKVDNRTKFPGPIMIESTGQELSTSLYSDAFQSFPKLGVIIRSDKPDIDRPFTPEHCLIDVSIQENPYLLSGAINLKVDPKTGAISHGYGQRNYSARNQTDTSKEPLSVDSLRKQYRERVAKQKEFEKQIAEKKEKAIQDYEIKAKKEISTKDTEPKVITVAQTSEITIVKSNKFNWVKKILKSFQR